MRAVRARQRLVGCTNGHGGLSHDPARQVLQTGASDRRSRHSRRWCGAACLQGSRWHLVSQTSRAVLADSGLRGVCRPNSVRKTHCVPRVCPESVSKSRHERAAASASGCISPSGKLVNAWRRIRDSNSQTRNIEVLVNRSMWRLTRLGGGAARHLRGHT